MPLNRLRKLWLRSKIFGFRNFLNEQESDRLLILINQFQTVHKLQCELGLKNQPVFLLIGPSNSGKTAFIENSQFTFLKQIPDRNHSELPRENSATKQQKHDFCNWSIAETCIFIEIPGHWFFSNEVDFDTWSSLLKVFDKFSGSINLQGILNFIPIHYLQDENETDFAKYQDKMASLLLKARPLLKKPLVQYTFITNIDRMHGFQEFFSGLRADERTRKWGCSFSENLKNYQSYTSLTFCFSENYKSFLQNLNDQLLQKLNHDLSYRNRLLISDFPIEMEVIKNKLELWIENVLEKFQFMGLWIPMGVFFCCAISSGEIINFLRNKTKSLEFEKSIRKVTLPIKTSYFINEIFNEIVENNYLNTNSKETLSWIMRLNRQKQRITAVLISASFVAIICSTIYYFAKNTRLQVANAVHQVQSLSQNMQNLRTSDTKTFFATLPSILNKFQQLQSFSGKPLIMLSSNMDQSVNHYQKYFVHNLLLPRLNQQIEDILEDNHADLLTRYETLKVYVMLATPDKLNKQEIFLWLKQNPAFQQANTDFLNQLVEFLATNKNSFNISQQSIATARSALSAYPVENILYQILKNNALKSNVSASISVLSQKIPYYYSLDGFQNIFLKQIKDISKPMHEISWVLGKTGVTVDKDLLTSQLIRLYFQNYSSTWQNILAQADFSRSNNFESYLSELSLFAGNQGEFAEALRTMENNLSANHFILTTAEANPNDGLLNQVTLLAAKQSLESTFAWINQYIDPQTKQLTPLANTLLQQTGALQTFFAEIGPEQAFSFLKGAFTGQEPVNPFTAIANIANSAPQPLQNILMGMDHQGITYVEKLAGTFVNDQWRTQVLPFWQQNIAGRYPLAKNAATDIKLTDFKQFFGVNGILQQFYDKYLVSFVDTSGTHWQWKENNAFSVPFNNKLLDVFERERIIREMFFPNDEQNFDVKFTLAPESIQSEIMSVDLNLAGETMINHPNSDNSEKFAWPSQTQTHLASLVFYSVDQKTSMINTSGPWALFKLFDQAMVEQTNDPKKYFMTFELNQMAAKYQLTADHPINPFIPGILNNFQCVADIRADSSKG